MSGVFHARDVAVEDNKPADGVATIDGSAAVAELVYAMASKAIVLRDMWVRIPPAALK
jgi:hypothetical protein